MFVCFESSRVQLFLSTTHCVHNNVKNSVFFFIISCGHAASFPVIISIKYYNGLWYNPEQAWKKKTFSLFHFLFMCLQCQLLYQLIQWLYLSSYCDVSWCSGRDTSFYEFHAKMTYVDVIVFCQKKNLFLLAHHLFFVFFNF